MKLGFQLIATMLVLGIFSGGLFAAIPERYQTIVDRNPFGLNPPPPPPPLETVSNTPPANIKITGFATIFGKKRAFFVIQPKDAKEMPQYINLAEGEREGVLEIVNIAEENGEARIKNAGVEMVLSLQNNGMNPAKIAPGVTQAPVPQPPPAPVVVGGSPQAAAQPKAGNPASPVFDPASSPSVVVNYTPPAPQGGAPAAPVTASGMPQPTPAEQAAANHPPGAPAQPSRTGMRTIPTRTLRLPPVTPQSSIVQPIAGGNSVVWSSPTPSTQQDPKVEQAKQIFNMVENDAKAKSRGLVYPPLPFNPQ